ncbi:uncharacterized protein V1516DRAFT_628905 [Lipomyces oligophaga]|uniref:uncharacterized protein n=1 Tax=Lipomyces oligophaga TaxID=45792 RepID=UPI0034CD65C8
MSSKSSSPLKHSNSTISLHTSANLGKMWDSSDPERRPPPLPMAESTGLPASPVRNSPFLTSSPARSKQSQISPVRSILKPANSYETDLIHLINKLHDQILEIDETTRSSDYTIRKAEKEVESLLRRSKDNAVDLVTLKDKVYNTETMLNKQFTNIVQTMSKNSTDTILNFVQSRIEAEHSVVKDLNIKLTDVKAILQEQSSSLQKLVQYKLAQSSETSRHASDLESVVHSTQTDIMSSLTDIVVTIKQLHENQQVQAVERKSNESETRIIAALENLRGAISNPDDRLQDIIKRVEEVRSHSESSRTTLNQIDSTLPTLRNIFEEFQLETKNGKKTTEMSLDQLNDLVASLKEQNLQTQQSVLTTIDKRSDQIVSNMESAFSAQIESYISSTKTDSSKVFSAIEELQSTLVIRGDSILETEVMAQEKLDQVLKDLHIVSSTVQAIPLLPKMHSDILESSEKIERYYKVDKSNLQNEIESLRHEKAKVSTELASLTELLECRKREMRELEDRAETFQKKLLEHVLAQPSQSARASSSKISTPILTECEEETLNISDRNPVYSFHRIGISDNISISSREDRPSVDISRPFGTSEGAGNRRASWSRKFGTIFSGGKENELIVPKKGSRKPGKMRSVSEKLF